MNSPNFENSNSTDHRAKIQEILHGFQVMQSIFAATKLGIPDLIGEGQKSCDELAAATDTNSEALYRLLKALAAIEIFVETEPKYFKLAPLGTCLLNEPGSMRNYVLSHGEIGYPCWGELIYSLRTGQSSFEHIYGMKRIEYFMQNADLGQIWDGFNVDLSRMQNDAILGAYDFSTVKKIVDLGGGEGILTGAILKRYSSLRGVLLDRERPIKKARDLLTKEGVIDRCELMVGDFSKSVPAEADIYLLKNVLRDLEEATAKKMLENCYQTLGKEAKFLVIERVISETRWADNFSNLNSLVISGAKMRTENEYRQLFEANGFKIAKIIPTESVVSIIECIPNK